MEEPLFNQLRTQEQLGYDVSCLLRDTYGVVGYSITVCTQANKFTTEYVDERIEAFIQFLINFLKTKTPDEYKFVKNSLIKSKQCVDIDLKEEVNRNWTEITDETYIFDRYDKEIEAIKCITIEQLLKWLNDHTVNGKDYRKLSIQIVGTANKDKNDKGNEMENHLFKLIKQKSLFNDTTFSSRRKRFRSSFKEIFLDIFTR
jgi:nardilysin